MDLNLKEYFEKVKGTGVLATADGGGLMDTAITQNLTSWTKKPSPSSWRSD
jgi:hypothetical protein